jgi:2-keto-4-pentenoate hydratase/2-oxohepta-3-ene-1,7-dioic acid hydratase in catechol pathway
MKLLRYGLKGEEKPGFLDKNGDIRSLANIIPDLSGNALAPNQLAKLKTLDPTTLPKIAAGTRIGPCVAQVGKFLCIGLNYRDHAKEIGVEIPREPIVFSKATSAISGPYDSILIPRKSKKTDWEVELGVVIGSPAKYVSNEKALECVAGYCLINDLSEREFQLEGTGQWIKGKSCDTFGPIGPWLVTRDEILDPQNIHLWLEVDGHRYQDSNTKEMAFGVAFLVSYLSQFFTLYPGDIISTGTPSGVGLGQKPEPFYLKPGQVMHLGATGLGEQTQKTILEV